MVNNGGFGSVISAFTAALFKSVKSCLNGHIAARSWIPDALHTYFNSFGKVITDITSFQKRGGFSSVLISSSPCRTTRIPHLRRSGTNFQDVVIPIIDCGGEMVVEGFNHI